MGSVASALCVRDDMWDPHKYYNAQFTIIIISECSIDQLFSLKPTGVGNRVDRADNTRFGCVDETNNGGSNKWKSYLKKCVTGKFS